jgi:hypothetical protein
LKTGRLSSHFPGGRQPGWRNGIQPLKGKAGKPASQQVRLPAAGAGFSPDYVLCADHDLSIGNPSHCISARSNAAGAGRKRFSRDDVLTLVSRVAADGPSGPREEDHLLSSTLKSGIGDGQSSFISARSFSLQ